MFRSRPIPRLEKRAFGPAGGPPTDGVADGRVTRRHRLTVQTDPLPKPTRQPCVHVGEAHALGPDATVATPEPAQRVAQRHRMLRPRYVVPRAHLRIADVSGPSSTARADIALYPPALHVD